MIKIYCDKCGKEITDNVNTVTEETEAKNCCDNMVMKFASASYQYYDECMEKLEAMARKGIVMRWDPFKDGCMIEMLLSDLLEVLASYKPEKGLAVWFSFKPAKNQLQMQPVKNSKKREQFIRNLLNK